MSYPKNTTTVHQASCALPKQMGLCEHGTS